MAPVQMVCIFPCPLRQSQRNKRAIFADYFFDRLFKYKEIMFQHDPKSNINQKIASEKSSPSRHLGSASGPNLRKTQEGKDFQLKNDDFGTDFGAHFLLALLVFFGRYFFWIA